MGVHRALGAGQFLFAFTLSAALAGCSGTSLPRDGSSSTNTAAAATSSNADPAADQLRSLDAVAKARVKASPTPAPSSKPAGSATPSPTAHPSASPTAPAATPTAHATSSAVSSSSVPLRPGFVGAFFRPQGSPPFGIFSASSPGTAPDPYPSPQSVLTGSSGYCDTVAANGVSIRTGFVVDSMKLSNIVNLGVRWVRMAAPQFNADLSHMFAPGTYAWGSFDSAQCATLAYHQIQPVVNLEAGPVMYNATPGTFSPTQTTTYATAADFGSWCGAVAAHERATFPSVSKFSLPGNEVNTNPQLFPGGPSQIAAYSKACYSAIKAANPNSFVYGFDLNMDGQANAPAFVRQLASLGCAVKTCYDGISMHLSLRYPIPAPGTPCYPNAGGDYSMQCVTDIESAAQVSHVLISESVYTVPGMVPDEQTKASAVVAAFKAYAANSTVDGVSYANVDECALYPSGYFSGGCLIDTSGASLPAYFTLQQLAGQYFQ